MVLYLQEEGGGRREREEAELVAKYKGPELRTSAHQSGTARAADRKIGVSLECKRYATRVTRTSSFRS